MAWCRGVAACNFVLLLLNAAMVTALPCYEPCLYYANLNLIRRVQLQNSTGKPAAGTTIESIYSAGYDISALALDHLNGKMFWYDVEAHMIYKANLDGTGSQVLIRYGLGYCDGIAYDWSADNIYWTDSWHEWIEVASADGRNRKTVITGSIQQPRGILVEPIEGYLFWTEYGPIPKIGRARLDGTGRKYIVTAGLQLPNDLQIDYSAKRLYWIDSFKDSVESCDYNGGGLTMATDVSHYGAIYVHAYSLALFAKHSLVYFTDWYRSWVLFTSFSTPTISSLYQPAPRPMQIGQIRILHSSNQPPATSPCLSNKGSCSHMCLTINGTSYTCQCPTGLKRIGSNQCLKAELDYQVFVVDGREGTGKIFHLSKFVGQAQYQFEVLRPPQIGYPVGLDFDQDKKMLYWTDVHLNKIFRMNVNGSGFQTIVDSGIETPEGLQIDLASGLLYVADYNHEKIIVVKINGSMRMDLITTNIINPRDLVLYHEKGMMFFSDWQESHPKIESAFMDGTNRREIITSSIDAPSGLAIDKIEQRLYWCDMSLDRIESSNLDGTDRRVLFDHEGYDPEIPLESVTGEIQTPYGLALHQENVFWTDWTRRAVYSADKRIGGKINYITRGLTKPMQVHAYSNKKAKEFKKLYFFARAKINPSSLQTHSCFKKNCTGTYSREPDPCPVGYKQKRFSEVCANCSAPFGVYSYRCKCKDWKSCAHRAYSKLNCPDSNPFMQFKVRECVQVVNPGHCSDTKCPQGSSVNCHSDEDCLDSQKCCNTSCGMKCLKSTTNPATHPCEVNNGGCSHFCFRVPNNFTCGCLNNMILQPADNKTCILRRGQCATKRPCKNGGICQDINSDSYRCKCANGFNGMHCERCPDCPSDANCIRSDNTVKCTCINNVCQNNGTCIVFQNRTTCKCPQGFTGERCETALQCPRNFCNGHGACYSQGKIFKCQCSSKYTGVNCESNIACLSKRCKNNGTCAVVSGTATCQCGEKFTGDDCEIPRVCTPNLCSNGGVCSARGAVPICTCTPGYTGERCESRGVCYGNPCYNGGTCFPSNGSASCRCKPGWTGVECQIYNPCLPNPCKNGASCLHQNGYVRCQCLPKFTGESCESEITCTSSYCKNGGTCIFQGSRRKCICPAAYTGPICETHVMCSPNPCKNGGNCAGTSINTFTCSCQNGFIGSTCSVINDCLSNPCKNGGACVKLLPGAGYHCKCTPETTGIHCEGANPCASNPCTVSSTCLADGNDYKCKCNKGYKGIDCATRDYCSDTRCRKIDFCVNGQTGYTCSCDLGFTGQYCDVVIDRCEGKRDLCKNNGICHSTLEKAKCICDGHYGGATCEVYYGENILEITMVPTSSKPTEDAFKAQLASGYATYCSTTDCTGTSNGKRKRRASNSKIEVAPSDVYLVQGYPKSDQNSNIYIQFAVILRTNGREYVIPQQLLLTGFEAMKDVFARSLDVTVTSYQVIRIKNPKASKSSSKEQSSASKSGGLAAGLVVLILALCTVAIIAVYVIRKRRREKQANVAFNAFDNVMYDSNPNLERKEEPRVQINQQDGGRDEKAALEFNNIVYDARGAYANSDTVDFGLARSNDGGPMKVDVKEGMTGILNPYTEIPEKERQLPSVRRSDSTTISSSTNLKKDVLASIDDVFQQAPNFEYKRVDTPSSMAAPDDQPMVVNVKSVCDESFDGISGFANPWGSEEDAIFSEDDTRESAGTSVKITESPRHSEGPEDYKSSDNWSGNTDKQMIKSSVSPPEEVSGNKRSENYVDVQTDEHLESNA